MENKNKTVVASVVLAGASLLAILNTWEGNEYEVYNDIVGVPTVCQGITGKQVVAGKTYTPAECADLNAKAAAAHGAGFLACVDPDVQRRLKQNQYDAFASWTYNVGITAACKSTAVKKLNAGDTPAACGELLKWNKAGGKVVKGLDNRRRAEYALCIQ